MAINGSVANEENDSILISLLSPYKKVKRIISFEDETLGETTESFFYKEFRWSNNGITFSDYIELTDYNLRSIPIIPGEDFWINYKYTVAELYTGEHLEFISIALEIETQEGIIKAIPQIECCGTASNSCENLVIECCGDNNFNPYNLNKAVSNYKQLSQMVSNLFGHCVTYFKTDPKKETKDVILKEYSLYDVIEKSDINILVPDNQLPSREIKFTMFDMDLPDLFEIHIVKSEFEKIFGVGERPSQFDYLWFPLTDRMYEVNSISLPDDFFHESSYYRVNLSLYKDRKNRDYSDAEEIEEELNDLIDSADKLFGEEAEAEMDKVRKPNQYRETGLNSKDPLRKYLEDSMIIDTNRLMSNYTIISKHQYNLKTVEFGMAAVTYKLDSFLSQNGAFTFLTKPEFNVAKYPNIVITNIGYNSIGLTVFETSTNHGYSIGDYVQIKGTGNYNGLHKIVNVSDIEYTIDFEYVNSSYLNAKCYKEEYSTLIEYKLNDDEFSIKYTLNNIIIEYSNKRYTFNIANDNASMINSNWYGIIINFGKSFNQLSSFVYKLSEKTGFNPQKDAEFSKIYSRTLPFVYNQEIPDNGKWNLIGGNCSLSNIRIFKECIEEDNHNSILSQYVVNDSHLALLIDNAIPEIRSLTKNNPR